MVGILRRILCKTATPPPRIDIGKFYVTEALRDFTSFKPEIGLYNAHCEAPFDRSCVRRAWVRVNMVQAPRAIQFNELWEETQRLVLCSDLVLCLSLQFIACQRKQRYGPGPNFTCHIPLGPLFLVFSVFLQLGKEARHMTRNYHHKMLFSLSRQW